MVSIGYKTDENFENEIKNQSKNRSFAFSRGRQKKMSLYIDSSVLLRYLLQSKGFVDLSQFKEDCVSSDLLKLECQRALIRYRLNQEVNDEGLLDLSEQFREILSRISLLKINDEVLRLAEQNWGVILGTLDSIHLASALYIQMDKKEPTVLLTHDKALFAAARLSNLEVLGI